MTCSFNISLKLQAGFLEFLSVERSPERYLLITLIGTIVTEAKRLQKIVHIIECNIKFSLKTWERWTWKHYWRRSSKAYVPIISRFKCIKKRPGTWEVCALLCPSLGSSYMFELSSLTLHPSFLFFFICCFLSSLISAPFFREKKKRAMVLQSCMLLVGGCFPRLIVTVEKEMTTF